MLEVLDPEQNHNFSDHYIEETYDLSKVMFIATANNLAINSWSLRDRMEIISIAGYTEIEKIHIAKDHLLPKQLENHGLSKTQLQVREEALQKSSVIILVKPVFGVWNDSLQVFVGKLQKSSCPEIKSVSSSLKRMSRSFLGKTMFHYGQAEVEDQVGVATGLAIHTVGGDTLANRSFLITRKREA